MLSRPRLVASVMFPVVIALLAYTDGIGLPLTSSPPLQRSLVCSQPAKQNSSAWDVAALAPAFAGVRSLVAAVLATII